MRAISSITNTNTNTNTSDTTGSAAEVVGPRASVMMGSVQREMGDANALLLPPVDVRDMQLATSPAGSVESDFWGDGGDGGDGNGNGNVIVNVNGFDPMEAAHKAVDRLMGSAPTPSAVSIANASTDGHGKCHGNGGNPYPRGATRISVGGKAEG
ncbi:unnamed protein product, partial [Scytosiphon promiscuus]